MYVNNSIDESDVDTPEFDVVLIDNAFIVFMDKVVFVV